MTSGHETARSCRGPTRGVWRRGRHARPLGPTGDGRARGDRRRPLGALGPEASSLDASNSPRPRAEKRGGRSDPDLREDLEERHAPQSPAGSWSPFPALGVGAILTQPTCPRTAADLAVIAGKRAHVEPILRRKIPEALDTGGLRIDGDVRDRCGRVGRVTDSLPVWREILFTQKEQTPRRRPPAGSAPGAARERRDRRRGPGSLTVVQRRRWSRENLVSKEGGS